MKNKQSKKTLRKIKKEHIDKISNIAEIEDLFLLTYHFETQDYKELKESIKKINKEKNKSDIHKNILKLINDKKKPEDIKEDIFKILIEEIENRYNELKDKGTELRKKGKDTLLPELKLMSLQYKLKLFKATKNKKDYLKIKKIILDIQKDLI